MDPKETNAASEKASGAAAFGRYAAALCCQPILLARVGRGKRLHLLSSDGLTALCGRGPIIPVVGTIENLCAECASIAAALPVRKCQICGKVFRGEICPAQTEYDAEIGDYVHPDNPTLHPHGCSAAEPV
jgi:hypothetical protein